ncbi:MAG: formylglycine-generating enzyme family protein [Myxococcota bacterium]|nr:formylglycine-generating enzyme family protein [Myxococcota bacterium]
MRWFVRVKKDSQLADKWSFLRKEIFENDEMALIIQEMCTLELHDACTTLIDIDDRGIVRFAKNTPRYGRDLASVVIFALAADAPDRHILQYLLTIGGLDRILIQHLESASFSLSPYWLQERVIGVMSSCIQIDEGIYDIHSAPEGHTVYLDAYEIGTYPVTQAFYESLLQDNPSLYLGLARPVDNLSWFEAVQFCNRFSKHVGLEEVYKIHSHGGVSWERESNGYRLPTELEWEVAARGNHSYLYAGSDSADAVACYRSDEREELGSVSVGMRQSNGFELYDMSGNVFEWCYDRFAAYPAEFPDNYDGPKRGSTRVRRGGAWNSTVEACTISHRSDRRPRYRASNTGFRLARTLY